MPLVQTRGAASAQGFGEFAQATAANYIEDVFSTYLYTGNGSTQTITNGIDLSGKGGLVWTKTRNSGVFSHELTDTVRGAPLRLQSDTTNAQNNGSDTTSFNSTGFGLTFNNGGGNLNNQPYVSWTFREQPKFFDVVTYTGDGTAARAINHNLGSTPGCMIVKRTDAAGDWRVYHRGCSTDNGLVLNDTAAQTTSAIYWFGNEVNVIPPTSTQFTVNAGFTNTNGGTYVAYLFAHNAGGFGLTGTDNVISCGSFTTDGSGNATVSLGYEPQWVLVKSSSNAENWYVVDNMRGFPVSGDNKALLPNLSNAEGSFSQPNITNTGFVYIGGNASRTYIYIAIRRGPMKVPTLGTSVFTPIARTGTGATATVTGGGFATDLALFSSRNRATSEFFVFVDRLRGRDANLGAAYADVEYAYTNAVTGLDVMDGFKLGADTNRVVNFSGYTYINYFFRRAPGFFDVVCYTGTGSALNPNHNLGVTPELKIIKSRSGAVAWIVGGTVIGGGVNFYMFLETNAIVESTNYWSSGSDSATTFSTRSGNSTSNSNGQTYVAYLFATLAGVSKVFSYTGNGSSQTINCGFTGGSRFVMIKRTDSTGDWYVWDSARGIVAGNDPRLSLNTTAAEVTTDDSVDTDNTGFIVNQVAATNVNVSSATYIGLAIA